MLRILRSQVLSSLICVGPLNFAKDSCHFITMSTYLFLSASCFVLKIHEMHANNEAQGVAFRHSWGRHLVTDTFNRRLIFFKVIDRLQNDWLVVSLFTRLKQSTEEQHCPQVREAKMRESLNDPNRDPSPHETTQLQSNDSWTGSRLVNLCCS